MKKVFFILIFIVSILDSYSQELIPYRIKDKWGYSSINKKIIVQPEYDSVTFPNKWFNESVGYIYKNKYQGIINEKGKVIIRPNEYEKLIQFNSKSFLEDFDDVNFSSLITKKNKKYGIISNRNLNLKPQFDEIKITTKYIKLKGGEMWKDELIGKKGRKWYLIQKNGTLKEFKYSEENEEQYEEQYEDEVYYVSDESNSIKHKKNLTKLPKNLENILDSISGKVNRSSDLLRVYRNGKVGVIQKANISKGIINIEPIYDEINNFFEKSNTVLCKKDSKWYLVTLKGEVIWVKKCQLIRDYDETIIYSIKEYKGVYFIENNTDTTAKYISLDWIEPPSGYFKVQTKGGWGYIINGIEYFED